MELPRAPHITDNDDNESTLSSPGHRRFQLRSSSWSAWAAKIPTKILLNTKSNPLPRPLRQKRKEKRSVTFEDVLGSDGVRQELGFSGKGPRFPGIYQEPAPSEVQGHIRPQSEENSRTSINESQDSAIQAKDRVSRCQMRTVSQDDYLLARGANPRTGIISPSVVTPGHSLENSLDKQEAFETRAAAGESKWRQNGDQWISLGLDQPTPTGSPPKLDASTAIPLQHKIQRKPVGSPPRWISDDRERSSSAPTPRKFKCLDPRDAGTRISDVPEKPFLGPTRGRQVFDVSVTGLRCPPTNNIQSQSPLSNQTGTRVPRGERPHLPVHTQKPSGPRTSDPSYPHLRYQRPEIPPRHYRLIQDMQTGERTASNPKHVRDQRDIRVVHPPFQPRSLRGMISDPREMVVQECTRQQHLANDIYTPQPNTISMSIGTRIPSSISNYRFQDKRIPSENTSFPMNRTKPWEVIRPHMPDRSEEMIAVPKVSQITPERQQLSQIGTSYGATSASTTPEVDPGVNPFLLQKNMRFHQTSSEDKLRSMPGSIRTFDGPVEDEVAISDDMVPSPAATGSYNPRHAITAARRAMGYVDREVGLDQKTATRRDPFGNDTSLCVIAEMKRATSFGHRVLGLDESISACLETPGNDTPERATTTLMRTMSLRNRMVVLEESAVAYFEPLLIGLRCRLEQMGYCIIATLRNLLRVTYIYSETGKMKIEGVLVVDVLRSIIYTLILGAIAVALAKAVGLVVRVGACIVWVFKGVFWVLM